MPTDATGTPTSLGIPTFNVDVDAPSGLGFNEAMAAIDTLLPQHTLSAKGDILYASAANTLARLAAGADGDILTLASGVPSWAAATSGIPTVTAQSTDYTAALSDAENWVRMNVGSANNFTIPPSSSVAFPVGTTLTVEQQGAGQTTFVAGAGVTLHNTPGLKIAAQYGIAQAFCLATDEWVVFGNLSP